MGNAEALYDFRFHDTLRVMPDRGMGVERGAHLAQGPAFDESDLVLCVIARSKLAQQRKRRDGAIDFIIAGLNAVRFAVNPRQQLELPRRVKYAGCLHLVRGAAQAAAVLQAELERFADREIGETVAHEPRGKRCKQHPCQPDCALKPVRHSKHGGPDPAGSSAGFVRSSARDSRIFARSRLSARLR